MQEKKIVNIIRKMVILKLVKEIEKDDFRPVTSVRQRKKIRVPMRNIHNIFTKSDAIDIVRS